MVSVDVKVDGGTERARVERLVSFPFTAGNVGIPNSAK